MSYHDILLQVYPDDRIYTPGIDWSADLSLEDFNFPFLFIRKAGGVAYLNRGSGSVYSEPAYHIWKLEKKDSFRYWKAREIERCDYNRQNKKEIRQQVFTKYLSLIKEIK